MQAVPLGYTPWVAEGAASPAINIAGRDEQKRREEGVLEVKKEVKKLRTGKKEEEKKRKQFPVAAFLSPGSRLSLSKNSNSSHRL